MKQFWSDIGYAAAGLAAVVGGYFWWGASSGWACVRPGFLIFLGLLFIVVGILLLIRDAREGTLWGGPSRYVVDNPASVQQEMKMPWSVLVENFRRLSKHDELAVCEPQSGFLSWNTGQFAIIQVHRQGDSEDWQALFWLREPAELRDTTLETICARHQVEMPTSFRKMKVQGVAFYRGGTLTIYPAGVAAEFREAFCDSVLAPKKQFSAWLADYTAE